MKNMIDEFWEMIAETTLASGHLHQRMEDSAYGIITFSDDNGRFAIWHYDKKNSKIFLEPC